MDTIHDSLEETSGAESRRAWKGGDRHIKQPMPVSKPRGRPFSREANWHTIALVGAGLAAGAVLGASLALLLAPQSGAHTRLALTKELRRRRPWRRSPWQQLGEELKHVAHNRMRRLRRTDEAE
jgi:hypothetical protein